MEPVVHMIERDSAMNGSCVWLHLNITSADMNFDSLFKQSATQASQLFLWSNGGLTMAIQSTKQHPPVDELLYVPCRTSQVSGVKSTVLPIC